jgi:hypothetical protein
MIMFIEDSKKIKDGHIPNSEILEGFINEMIFELKS